MRYCIFLFCLAGCGQVISDLNVPTVDKKPVLFFLPQTNQSLTGQVSLTVPILETNTYSPVTNAVVALYQGNNKIGDLTLDGTTYQLQNYTLQANTSYTLEVSVPGYATARATSVMPISIPWTRYAITLLNPPVKGRGRGTFDTQLDIYFNDPSGENYYAAELFKNNTSSTPQQVRLYFADVVYSNDDDYTRTSTVYFPDRYFTSNNASMKFYFNRDSNATSWTLVFYHLSKEYYTYITTRNAIEDADGDPFAQPIQVYTNVENGLGIFAGYSVIREMFTISN